MIDFDEAASIAEENLYKLVKQAKNAVLEGVLISNDGKLYEVTFSYDIDASEDITTSPFLKGAKKSSLFALSQLLSARKEYKIFLVNCSDGKFRGFKNVKKE